MACRCAAPRAFSRPPNGSSALEGRPATQPFADRVADAWIKAQAYRLHTFGTVTRLAGGGELGAESSVTKVFWSDLDVALHQTALDLQAPTASSPTLGRTGCSSLSAARSTPAPTRFSATSSPSGYSGCHGNEGDMNFELDDQQRDFAASIDAALAAADVPGAVRAWALGDTAPGRKLWAQLADLGVTALAVPERHDGIEAHPVDLVVADGTTGRWCVPGPVTESIAMAPVLLADDERSAALAAGGTDRHGGDAAAGPTRCRRGVPPASSWWPVTVCA